MNSGSCNNEDTGPPLLQPALLNVHQQFGFVDHLLFTEGHSGWMNQSSTVQLSASEKDDVSVLCLLS